MAESYAPNPGVTQRQHELLIGHAMPSGMFGHPDDTPVVYADGVGTREVRIRVNKSGAVEGYYWQNVTGDITLPALAANTSGSTRVDLVVLRLDRAAYSLSVQVVQGSPGAGAPSPTYNFTASGVTELPLATVTVANNATTLAASTVTDKAWYLNEDGLILCKAATMPPGIPGRVVFRTDTGQYLLSNGTTWSPTAEDSGLLSLTLQSGWSATLNRVQKRNGTVVVAVKASRSTTISAGATVKIGQLPAGCYPTFEVPAAAVYESSAGLAAELRVTTAGGVYVDVPQSVDINANRPLAGSLTFHAA